MGTRRGITWRSEAAPARVSTAGQRSREMPNLVARIADRDGAPGRLRRDPPPGERERRRQVGPLLEPVPAQRVQHSVLVSGRLHVEVQPDVVAAEELEGVVEGELVLGELLERMAEAKAGRDVELDDVDPGGDRRLQRSERVLRRERCRPAVPDHERPAGLGSEEVHVRRSTTIAQSSGRSPPPNSRQAASTASATSCAGRAAFADSTSSSRSSPKSSRPARDSITPSV